MASASTRLTAAGGSKTSWRSALTAYCTSCWNRKRHVAFAVILTATALYSSAFVAPESYLPQSVSVLFREGTSIPLYIKRFFCKSSLCRLKPGVYPWKWYGWIRFLLFWGQLCLAILWVLSVLTHACSKMANFTSANKLIACTEMNMHTDETNKPGHFHSNNFYLTIYW